MSSVAISGQMSGISMSPSSVDSNGHKIGTAY